MKNSFVKKSIAMLLAASLVFNQAGVPTYVRAEAEQSAEEAAEEAAEETSNKEEKKKKQKEAAPETKAPETEAPETKAPETQAPETKAPETEAPETQAPETQATETEKVTEAVTEKPTEKVTEKPTEKVTETESETETETEDAHLFVLEKKNFTITVELPDDLELPKASSLVMSAYKKNAEEDTDQITADMALIDAMLEEDGEYQFEEGKFYDIHFENGEDEVEIEKRDKKDIKVSIEYKNPVFADLEFEKEDVILYHLRDMTDEEVYEATLLAEEENTTLEDERVVEELDTELKLASGQAGIAAVTFHTDSFSDYVLSIIKEIPETEAETETETEAVTEKDTEAETEEATEVITESETEEVTETESETEEITETETETESESESELETEAPFISVDEGETHKLTLQVSIIGKEDVEEASVVVTGETPFDQEVVKAYAGGEEIVPVFSDDDCALTVQIPVALKTGEVVLEGIETGEYTVDAGGNYLDANILAGNADYYSLYSVADDTDPEAEPEMAPVKMLIQEDSTLMIKNIYSTINASAVGEMNKNEIISGVKYQLLLDKKMIREAVSGAKGASFKGIPAGNYSVRVVSETIPGIYLEEALENKVILTEEKPSVNTSFQFSAITVVLTSVDSISKAPLSKVTVTIKDKNGTTIVKEPVNDKGELTLKGILERNKEYTISQTAAPGHYAPGTMKLKIVNSKIQKGTITNKPTVLKISVKDNVSETSPYKGEYIAGAKIEIRKYSPEEKKIGDLVKTVTSTNGVLTLTGELDPGNYIVIQKEATPGYLKDNTGKARTLSKADNDKEAEFSNDTVKVQFSRMGYDERTPKGDGKYDYKNLRPIDDATLEIQDLSGNVIKDKNGKPVRWTTKKSEEIHVVEGVLAADTKYKIVEVEHPIAFEPFTGGEFTVKATGTKVTLPTRKGSGKITVALKAVSGGASLKMSGSFYCALYTDPECKNVYKAAGVKKLTQNPQLIYTTAVFENIASGVYYVSECNASGKAITSGNSYTITYENQCLNLKPGGSLLAIITHTYKSKPSGATEATASESNSANKGLYGGFGGSSQAAAEMAQGGTKEGVKTGDNTNIMLYVGLLGGALILFILLLFLRKRRK